MLNVFIAGATGYIGSGLAEELLRRGHAVIGLVRLGLEKRLPKGEGGSTRIGSGCSPSCRNLRGSRDYRRSNSNYKVLA